MKSLLVTGAHHRAVCALYERQLELVNAQLALERERALKLEQAREELSGRLVGMFEAEPAAPGATHAGPARRRRAHLPENFDPGDPKQLFMQAREEVGSNNASRVLRRMQVIRDRTSANGTTGVSMPAPNQADVQTMIDDAEFEGMTMDELPLIREEKR